MRGSGSWGDRNGAAAHAIVEEAAGGVRRGESRPLAEAEVAAVLRRNWWAVLSTAAASQPYAVPVAYGMADGAFYIASREGRKVSNVRENPLVCLTVVEVASGATWSSVVVTGRAECVDGAVERLRALDALRRQCGRPGAADRQAAARAFGAKLLRIDAVETTGRGRGTPDEDRPHAR